MRSTAKRTCRALPLTVVCRPNSERMRIVRSVGGLYLSRTDLNFGLLLSGLYLGKLPSGLYLEKVHCT